MKIAKAQLNLKMILIYNFMLVNSKLVAMVSIHLSLHFGQMAIEG
jgi:hypothetical protein